MPLGDDLLETLVRDGGPGKVKVVEHASTGNRVGNPIGDPTTQKAKEIFISLIGKVSPDEWDSHVHQACGTDEDLQQQVLILLQAHRHSDDFLEKPAPNFGPIVEQENEQLGSQIGPYKLLEQIGEGGMGVVYRAEQQEPVCRTVALKIVKPGMDTRDVVARFKLEQQALARMEHPNIAKVFGAGATESGCPYFVMELVPGATITRFADQHRLTTRQRLDLYCKVCEAVQHAHQKGIIHRDIKPSNVLVGLGENGVPIPKIIDFGIAKAVKRDLAVAALTISQLLAN